MQIGAGVLGEFLDREAKAGFQVAAEPLNVHTNAHTRVSVSLAGNVTLQIAFQPCMQHCQLMLQMSFKVAMRFAEDSSLQLEIGHGLPYHLNTFFTGS